MFVVADPVVADAAQGWLLLQRRYPLRHRSPGAGDGRVDGADRGVHHRGDLGRGEAQHLEQEQGGALVAGQVLQGRHEGQFNRLAALVNDVMDPPGFAARLREVLAGR